jgi:hypothetical protein
VRSRHTCSRGRRRIAARTALASGTLVLICSADAAAQTRPSTPPAGLPPTLTQARAALDRYRDPIAAVHDGYFSSVGCVEYPNGGGHGAIAYKPGGMGVHFLNMGLVGPTLDPRKPQILIYEPDGDSLRLVAAEWFVPVQAAGGTRPAIFGRELDGPMEGHTPLMPAALHHYDLHVWLWKANPDGVFSATNPAVKCPPSAYSFAEAAPKLVPAHGP